jgi:hypothetical protein
MMTRIVTRGAANNRARQATLSLSRPRYRNDGKCHTRIRDDQFHCLQSFAPDDLITSSPEKAVRSPLLPRKCISLVLNPLGSRAMYLWQGNKDTLYRIHGTVEPWTIGKSVSSGCIRMINQDVIDLYQRTTVGAKVAVLPSRL